MTISPFALVKRFAREERGATMIEYGVLVGLITAAVVALVATIGGDITARFQAVADALAGAVQP
jgi:pilus assembly protein Flp/PilA